MIQLKRVGWVSQAQSNGQLLKLTLMVQFSNRTIGVNLVRYMLVGGVFNADNKSDRQVSLPHVGTNAIGAFSVDSPNLLAQPFSLR